VLRLVLAVALAASLVAVATPTVEDARTTRTERLAERELDRVAAAANSLAREEDPGARRTLGVSFPGESPTEAPLAFVAVGGLPDGELAVDTAETDVLAYRVAGGRQRVLRVEADLRIRSDEGDSVASDSRPLVLRSGETYRLILRLARLDGRRTVVVTSRDI
jgi:hypothetical protein